MALLLSAWNVYFRDVSNVVDVLQTIITWTVPMIYPFGILMDKLENGAPDWSTRYTCPVRSASPSCSTTAPSGPRRPPRRSSPRDARSLLPHHLFERGAVMIVLGFLFVLFAQADLRPARGQLRREALLSTSVVVDTGYEALQVTNQKTLQ